MLNKLLDLLLGKNTLFYKGCTINFALKHIAENYRKILRKLGVDFIELPEENCCGSILNNIGKFDEFKKLAEKNYKIFSELRIKEMICPCPTCTYIFKEVYPEYIKDWDIEVYHISEVILKRLKELDLKLLKLNLEVGFHDPCHLGRYLGIYEEPRKILEKIGVKVKEVPLSKEFSFCCGGGGGLRARFEEISKKIGEERIKQFLDEGVKNIVTCCPMCYIQLKEIGKKYGVNVFELSELLLMAFGFTLSKNGLSQNKTSN